MEHNWLRKASSGQFRSGWASAYWNGQGLIASDINRQARKVNKAYAILSKVDFLGLGKTHGKEGKVQAIKRADNSSSLLCNCPTGNAGVGLIVKNAFLDQFLGWEWINIAMGRAGVLRLQGSNGDLDIFSIYLPTGNSGGKSGRIEIIKLISQKYLRDREICMSIVMGDFNHVNSHGDRYSTEEFTGNSDKLEGKETDDYLGQHGLKEIEQPLPTYRGDGIHSRTDRIYSNHHTVYQLDSDLGATTLDWDDFLSRHRPILGFRRIKINDDFKPSIDESSVRNVNWSKRVIAHAIEIIEEKNSTTRV